MTTTKAPETVKTSRLRLAAWRPEDALALRTSLDRSDAHLRPWIPFMRREPQTLEATERELARYALELSAGGHARYAIWNADDELVGEVMLLRRAGPDALEVGYWLDVDQCGHGYATEAARAMVQLAFEGMGVGRVQFQCDVRNAPSNALPRRLGASVVRTEEVEEPTGEVVTLAVWELRRSAP